MVCIVTSVDLVASIITHFRSSSEAEGFHVDLKMNGEFDKVTNSRLCDETKSKKFTSN